MRRVGTTTVMVTPDAVHPVYFSATIPLPPKQLSPNARLHWAAKHRWTANYREACAWTYQAVIRRERLKHTPPPKKLILDVEFYSCREAKAFHPKDEDNARASLKAAVDALKDVGLIGSDAKDRLEWGLFILITTQRQIERRGKVAGVIISLRLPHGKD